MNRQDMLNRTMEFAVRIGKLVAAPPRGRVGDQYGRQLLRSGSSIGANYREAARASSRKHFITTLEIAEREAAESLYWIDLLIACGLVKSQRLAPLRNECEELLSILMASCRTAKQGLKAATASKRERAKV